MLDAVIWVQALEVGHEMGVEPVNELVAEVDGKGRLHDNGPGGALKALTVFKKCRHHELAVTVVIGLANLIDGGMGLLGISGAELGEHGRQYLLHRELEDLLVDINLDLLAINVSIGEVEVSALEHDGSALKGHV